MPVRITGVQETRARLEELARRARDLTPALAPSARECEQLIDRAWGSRRSPSGEQWAPTKEAPETPGSGLERAHRVVVERMGLRIVVPVPHAAFQFFGTRRSPARNALPIERVGGRFVLSRSGEAGQWVDRMLARVKAHLTGARV